MGWVILRPPMKNTTESTYTIVIVAAAATAAALLQQQQLHISYIYSLMVSCDGSGLRMGHHWEFQGLSTFLVYNGWVTVRMVLLFSFHIN